MMSKVVAGDYTGIIMYENAKKGLVIKDEGLLGKKKAFINKETVDHYELVDEESSKSFGSGVIRGAVGAAAFGAVGALAGAASAKNKKEYRVAITFKDEKRVLCSLDKNDYKTLTEMLF